MERTEPKHLRQEVGEYPSQSWHDLLKTKLNLNYTSRLSSYRAINTHCISVKKQSMLYREIIGVCSEIHTKNMNTLRGPNVKLLNVTTGGT
jgi:hypothetical protein